MRKLLLLATSLLFAAQAYSKPTKVVLSESNTIHLNDYFYSESVSKVFAHAKKLDSTLPKGKALYFVLNSGGGSIEAGIELIENLRSLGRPIVTITSFAASMGFQTVQGLHKRYVQKAGTLMSHKARGGFYGEFPGQLDSRYGYWLNRVVELDKKAVARTKGKHSLSSYHSLIENEYWCQGEDCIKQGFADAIAVASCDDTMMGTRVEADKFLFRGLRITFKLVFDKCPLNTGVLDWDVEIAPLMGNSMFFEPDPETAKEIHKEVQRRLNSIQENINGVVKKAY